jgi:hypothetical protein
MEEMPSLNMQVQRLKVVILPLDLPCSGSVTHSGEILTTVKSHGKKPDRFSLNDTWTDYKTNTQITKELKITPILDKLLEYKRIWIQHVNRMPRNRLPRVMKHYSLSGRRNDGRALKRLLDTGDRNGSTIGPTP